MESSSGGDFFRKSRIPVSVNRPWSAPVQTRGFTLPPPAPPASPSLPDNKITKHTGRRPRIGSALRRPSNSVDANTSNHGNKPPSPTTVETSPASGVSGATTKTPSSKVSNTSKNRTGAKKSKPQVTSQSASSVLMTSINKKVCGYSLWRKIGAGSYAQVYQGKQAMTTPLIQTTQTNKSGSSKRMTMQMALAPTKPLNRPVSSPASRATLTAGSTAGKPNVPGDEPECRGTPHEKLPEKAAIKVINNLVAPKIFIEDFLKRELRNWAKVKHPNCVELYHWTTKKGLFNGSNIDATFLVMEYCEKGDLLEFIRKTGPNGVTNQLAKRIFSELISAMEYMHNRLEIAHRDIKCENLLLDSMFSVKLADFGFSRFCKDDDGKDVLSNTFCGSIAYASPEVLSAKPYNPKKYDIWSCGVVLYIVLTATMPYDDGSPQKMLKSQEKGPTYPRTAKNLDENAKDLVEKILQVDIEKRYSLSQIRQHIWMTASNGPMKQRKSLPRQTEDATTVIPAYFTHDTTATRSLISTTPMPISLSN